MCLAEFEGKICKALPLDCRHVRIHNFVFPMLVMAFSPQVQLDFGVAKLPRVLVP